MPDLTPGTRVLVTFAGPVEAVVSSTGVPVVEGWDFGHGRLRALGATVTPIIPDEPAVGSVWIDGEGVAWLRVTWARTRWWSARLSDDNARTWPEVVARGGRLLHDAGTVTT